ncbi:hypothetical protein [bacterium endosymbiont of Bathymodiolus sp. 5 South]|jgi:hypothetical protein|uniref:hypothetical protein n=1 Tax=bacterium endosymbiont of Bathymodiolus sp. 5 South TaxID=1181670 RepID=UPI001119D338|nr:hypothetical protein [bacterium endosymbiont of Bathymodiolus sp. 5 South]VVH55831.1 hypothetical protein BSPCLSOX_592 [uncultured Gammaproteobacteria bacterium]VVH61507.1 hypothetical protein BSPWISOX_1806 [uncultured Gammaproteobacteria bacterium]VVM20728.1 hypothetical protein BSPWISOXPB_936 [uncultured Gammaproteobacteria bacterium]
MHNDYIELTKNIFALYQKLTRKHGAMTVNERLWLSGYYDEYEASIKEQNISKFISISVGINVDTPSIKENLKRRGITITNEIEIMINDLKLEIMGTG